MFPGTGFCTQPLYFIVGRKVLPCSREVSPPPFRPAPASAPSRLASPRLPRPARLASPAPSRPPRLACPVLSASSRLSRPASLAARSHPLRLVASRSACLGVTPCPLSFAVSVPCRYTDRARLETERPAIRSRGRRACPRRATRPTLAGNRKPSTPSVPPSRGPYRWRPPGATRLEQSPSSRTRKWPSGE